MFRMNLITAAFDAIAAGGPAGSLNAAAFHAERRHVSTRFGNIALVERGSGEAALFLHGFPLSGFQWRWSMELLLAHRRCIAPDFMGLGYTEPAEGQSLAPEAQAEMLAALLDELSIERVDLVANDSGGQVAQLFVARFPERVHSLLLTNCDTEIDSPPAALLPVIELARRGEFADKMIGLQRRNPEFARSADGLGGIAYSDPAHPTDEAIEYCFAPLIESEARKARVHEFTIALDRNPLVGIGPALKRLAAPVRIVWGMADKVFSAESPDFLDQAFGNSRGVRRLEERNLFWPEELPEVLAEEALALWGYAERSEVRP